MPLLTDEQAADLAIATINSTPTPSQLAALQYIEQNVLSQIHQEHSFVDVPEAFNSYDALYFRGALAGRVDVSWSARMTLCAGTCELRSPRTDGKRSTWPAGIMVRIKLSEPILKFRPNIDVLNTLIHEMIHAYFFVAGGKHVRGDDPSGHGFGFLALANAINKHSQNFYSITVYHNFHDEVDHYRTHMWQCTGPCTAQPPFFGLVKRAMNRPPGPSDTWYTRHQETCGGDFIKISGPPDKDKDSKSKGKVQKNKIVGWLKGSESEVGGSSREGSASNATSGFGRKRRREKDDEGGRGAGGNEGNQSMQSSSGSQNHGQPKHEGGGDDVVILGSNIMVVCPVCFEKVWESRINQHLDNEHGL